MQKRVFPLLILTALNLYSQGVVTTVAGTDFTFPNTPIRAINAPLGSSNGVASDSKGNVYVADRANSQVVRISPDGSLIVVAGNGVAGFSGDGGPATAASMVSPNAVAVDAADNLYISENNHIRKVSGGTIATIATFNGAPGSLALDAAGNLYVLELSQVLKMSGGTFVAIAGTGEAGFSGDGGPATSALFNVPNGIAVDSAGNLYISDFLNGRVRKVSGGIITTVAGKGMGTFVGDGGPATSASLSPQALTLDSAGNLYIADGPRVRKVSGGIITTIAGNGIQSFSGDGGPATSASFYLSTGLCLDPAGNLYIADAPDERIRRVNSKGVIDTIAGNGSFRFSGDGGPATSATLNLDQVYPAGLALDSSGNLYIADTDNKRVRKVSGGVITTVAGGTFGDAGGDGGPATSARLLRPSALAVDPAGNLYISDFGLGVGLVRIVSGGIITSLSTTGEPLTSPDSLAVDSAGNLYATDRYSNRVYKVSKGVVTVVAGTGKQGFSGDGGAATSATFAGTIGLAVDAAGSIYLADYNNRRIRKVSGGIVTTVAGNGKPGFSGDGGPATDATLSAPFGVVVDTSGNLYIADSNRIRKVSGGIITTVAGSVAAGFSGDGGLATNAALALPTRMVVDSSGALLIADTLNHRVRKVLPAPPTVQASPSQMQFSAASAGAPPVVQTISFSGAVPGLALSTSTQNGASWLHVSPQSGATPRLIEVSADPTNLTPGTYTGTIAITAPDAAPPLSMVTATFNVTEAQAPKLAIDKQSLSFPFPKDGAPRSRPLRVSNDGGGTLPFTAQVITTTGGSWLSVSPASGQVLPSAPVTLTVTANPSGLAPGTYSGSLTVAAGEDVQTVPVVMTISAINQAILLSQTGLSFLGVSQGGIVPLQKFGVINIGASVVNWTVSKSTLSGGPDWLQVGTSSGSTDAAALTVPTVGVSVNPASLAAGKYYGLVQVDAPGAANSPQVITVFLQVLAAGSDIGAVAQPAEVLFNASAAGGSPGSQDLLLYNIASAAKSFRASVATDPGLNVVVLPTDGTLDPQQPTRMIVQPFTDGLKAGIYNATVTLQFSDGRVRSLKVSVAVAAVGSSGLAARAAGASCTPTQLLTALTTLGQSFVVSAGWPVALGVDVQDDCGIPLDTGSVSVSFSNGDPPLSLTPVKGGHWETTWMIGSPSSQVVIKLRAADPQGSLLGERQVSGALQAQTDPPVFDKPGIVSTASGQPFVPLAPGSIMSIYGQRLAQAVQTGGSVPMPTTLQNTSVLIGGRLAARGRTGKNFSETCDLHTV